MNPMGTPDLRCIPKLMRAQIQHLAEQHKSPLDELRSFANLQRLGGIDDVIRSQPVVQPARGGGIPDGFNHIHRERNDVMLHARFEFVNARNVYFGAGSNGQSGVFRHKSSVGKRFRGGQLDIQPLLEAIRLAPDLAHLLAGVTWDQTVSPWGDTRASPDQTIQGPARYKVRYGRFLAHHTVI